MEEKIIKVEENVVEVPIDYKKRQAELIAQRNK